MSEHPPRDKTLASEIREATGENTARCYQCGKCSAGCPMAEEMSLKPHDMMRLVHFDQADRILHSEAFCLCLTCESCSTRCPNECDPARVIDALREMALSRNAGNLPKEIKAFHQAFLKQIAQHGRVFEFGLILGYKMRSMHLFQDVDAAPGMLSRGKLTFIPRRIKGIDEVRQIFERCRVKDKEPA